MQLSLLLLALATGSSFIAAAPTDLTPRAASRKYETVKGYFLQDEDDTDPKTFDPKTTNFGLLPSLNWTTLTSTLHALNTAAPSSTSYKLLFLARHGEGIHNAAEDYYGTIPWGAYWARQDGNSSVRWADAQLTATGLAQAAALGRAWRAQVEQRGTPVPGAFWVSPLERTCATANATFGGLGLGGATAAGDGECAFRPTVKEKLRETLGVFTPNRRSSKAYVAGRYPDYVFEEGFAEEDELWKKWWLELPFQQDKRSREVLDDLFGGAEGDGGESSEVVSFTSHSVTAESFLRVLGHRKFELSTGGMLPILVKSTLE